MTSKTDPDEISIIHVEEAFSKQRTAVEQEVNSMALLAQKLGPAKAFALKAALDRGERIAIASYAPGELFGAPMDHAAVDDLTPLEKSAAAFGYDTDRLSVMVGGLDLLEMSRTSERELRRLSMFGLGARGSHLDWLGNVLGVSRADACRQALSEQERLILEYGHGPMTESWYLAPARYRVTRRGNVYDDVERRTVWATWGEGSIRERLVLAQAKADELNATTPGITHTGPTVEQVEAARAGWRKRWPESTGARGPTPVLAAYLDWRPTRRLLTASDITLDTLLAVFPGERGRHRLRESFAHEVFLVGEATKVDGVTCYRTTNERPTLLSMPGILSIRGPTTEQGLPVSLLDQAIAFAREHESTCAVFSVDLGPAADQPKCNCLKGQLAERARQQEVRPAWHGPEVGVGQRGGRLVDEEA